MPSPRHLRTFLAGARRPGKVALPPGPGPGAAYPARDGWPSAGTLKGGGGDAGSLPRPTLALRRGVTARRRSFGMNAHRRSRATEKLHPAHRRPEASFSLRRPPASVAPHLRQPGLLRRRRRWRRRGSGRLGQDFPRPAGGGRASANQGARPSRPARLNQLGGRSAGVWGVGWREVVGEKPRLIPGQILKKEAFIWTSLPHAIFGIFFYTKSPYTSLVVQMIASAYNARDLGSIP